MEFHSLRVSQIVAETADAKTITFEIPAELAEKFAFRAGQYLTLKIEIDGEELRRSYSMSSSPLEKKVAVTVKKVSGGKVSTFLHDVLQVGQTLEIAEPEGRFTLNFDVEKRRSIYLIGAGSGVTPLLSLAKTALELEPQSQICLFLGSRRVEDIIFKDEFDRLATRYDGQFFVEHCLSQPPKIKAGGIAGFFGRSTMAWQGRSGRIDIKMLGQFLEENPPRTGDPVFFLCGPGTMMETVKAGLLGRGIEPKNIHVEHFLSAAPKGSASSDSASGGPSSRLIVRLNGQKIELPIDASQTVLDVLIKEKYEPPYSCTAGACSTCMAKCTSGKVKMDACFALDEDEIKAGWVLTCQARAESEVVEIDFDN